MRLLRNHRRSYGYKTVGNKSKWDFCLSFIEQHYVEGMKGEEEDWMIPCNVGELGKNSKLRREEADPRNVSYWKRMRNFLPSKILRKTNILRKIIQLLIFDMLNNTSVLSYMYTYTHACTYIHTHTCMHTYTYKHACIHTYTYIHTYSNHNQTNTYYG